MRDRHAVIIGSGLGGLQCGYILAKHGLAVTVLERHSQIGGCLQSFRRGGCRFDCGFHYVGGLEEGQPLHPLFQYFNLLDLPWVKMDEAGFEEIVIGSESFLIPNGYDRFLEALSERFPAERAGLRQYVSLLQEAVSSPASGERMRACSASGYLRETFRDPLLRKVLSGASMRMELRADTLPLFVFAEINSSYIQSAWRLRGGGAVIAERLAAGIMSMGGAVRTASEVTAIEEADGKAVSVQVNGAERLPADWIISDLHPALTLGLLGESRSLRPIFRRRIAALPDTGGLFTVNIRLKPGRIPDLNRALYIHTPEADLWHPDPSRTESVLVHFYPSDTACTDRIDLLTPMDYSAVSPWETLPAGRRGPGYEELKRRKAEECLDRIAERLPEVRSQIDSFFTSTPLTYRSYTGIPHGSAFGVRKDCGNPMGTFLSPKMPVKNLLITGQSLYLHGILGVSMTARMTCAEILGADFA